MTMDRQEINNYFNVDDQILGNMAAGYEKENWQAWGRTD